jgi:Domain of unknown function (DUF4082)
MRLLIVLAAALTAGSLAAEPALTFNPAGDSSGTENNQSVGWEFNVLTSITVTGLGWYDQGGDGLQMAHTVGIWDSSGTLLTSGLVAAGITDPLDGMFRTDSIASLTLAPGEYIVGGQNFSSDTEQLAFGVTPVTDPRLSFDAGEFSNIDGTFEEPTNPTAVPTCCWGPSFSISPAAPSTPEPNPGTLSLFGLITLGGALYWRRTRESKRTASRAT